MARKVRNSGRDVGRKSRAMGLCFSILFNSYICRHIPKETPVSSGKSKFYLTRMSKETPRLSLAKPKNFNKTSPPRHIFEDESTMNIFQIAMYNFSAAKNRAPTASTNPKRHD
jgi:hypothetical protein